MTSIVDTASYDSKWAAGPTATTGSPSVDRMYLCCWNYLMEDITMG